MLRQPIFDRLDDEDHILVAGAGGGFDVFSGLPLYFALREAGKEVDLASLSFSNLEGADTESLGRGVHEITAETDGNPDYFPERDLARWLSDNSVETSIYGIERRGFDIVREAYECLEETLDFDALVLVDGGTDSLMRGDEAGLLHPAAE